MRIIECGSARAIATDETGARLVCAQSNDHGQLSALCDKRLDPDLRRKARREERPSLRKGYERDATGSARRSITHITYQAVCRTTGGGVRVSIRFAGTCVARPVHQKSFNVLRVKELSLLVVMRRRELQAQLDLLLEPFTLQTGSHTGIELAFRRSWCLARELRAA
jgi:hypothetical protein